MYYTDIALFLVTFSDGDEGQLPVWDLSNEGGRLNNEIERPTATNKKLSALHHSASLTGQWYQGIHNSFETRSSQVFRYGDGTSATTNNIRTWP
ncbi:hypothetical protein KCU81_g156, partial [Aureobasidium melanogenum]